MCFMRVMEGLTEKINNTEKLYSSLGEVRFSLSIFFYYMLIRSHQDINFMLLFWRLYFTAFQQI